MREDFLTAVKKYGLATVAAIVFGYILLVDVRADQQALQQQHERMLTQFGKMIEEQQNLARGVLKTADKNGETQMLQEKILGVLETMCVQQATTQADRRECLSRNR